MKKIWSFPIQVQIEVEDYLLANEIFDQVTTREIPNADKVLILFDREKAIQISVDDITKKSHYRLATPAELKQLNTLTLDPTLAGIKNRSIDRMATKEEDKGGQAVVERDLRPVNERNIEVRKLIELGEITPNDKNCIPDICPFMASRMQMMKGARVDGEIPLCHQCGLGVSHGIYEEGS